MTAPAPPIANVDLGKHTPSVDDALSVVGVTSGYGSTTVLRDIDIHVRRGCVTALLGPNGAGKTTLLRTVSGSLHPSAGSIQILGEDVSRSPMHRRAAAGLCHIPEGRGVFRSLTVRENIEMQAGAGSVQDALERATDAFPVLGNRLDRRAGTLSGGQQQMLAMAAAYVRDPKLVLIDEASLGLAPRVVDEIFAFLDRRTSAGVSMLIVDQFVDRALDMATDVYVLSRGRITFAGTSDKLRRTDVFEKYLAT